nr:MAG TPA: hypothetical protein [Caudoviricetes sp.]
MALYCHDGAFLGYTRPLHYLTKHYLTKLYRS